MKTKYTVDGAERREKRRSALIIAGLCLVIVLLVGWINSIGEEKSPEEETKVTYTNTTVAVTTTAATTSSPMSEKTEEADNTTDDSSTQSTASTAPVSPATSESSAQMSTEEIVALFNKSANAIKADGVTVVRNYDKMSIREEYVEMPILKDTFVDLLKDSFTDDMTPIEFATKEDIIASYPVPGKEYASMLTAADVESATCTDKGSEYEIIIVLPPCEEPKEDSPVCKAFESMTNDQAMQQAPEMIKSFQASYVDCRIIATVNKKTGKMTHSNYSYTVITRVGLDMKVMEVDAQLAVDFERDYSISY